MCVCVFCGSVFSFAVLEIKLKASHMLGKALFVNGGSVNPGFSLTEQALDHMKCEQTASVPFCKPLVQNEYSGILAVSKQLLLMTNDCPPVLPKCFV